MKITKTKGFSLAELMIALLVISVALAAAAPTITKSISGNDSLWKTSAGDNAANVDLNTIYFNGPNLMIGTQRLPNFKKATRYFPDALSTKDFDFSPKTDKLVIMGSLADGNSLSSSHIAFYNQSGTANPTYAGRFATDRYNMALGIGSLQSLVPDVSDPDNMSGVYNTAIGHYALFMNKKGSYNTALGYKALQGASSADRGADYAPDRNIALGDHALQYVGSDNNIAIGSHAGRHLQGNNNIVIGVGAGYGLTGSNNLLINPMTALATMMTKNESVILPLIGHRDNTKYPIITNDDNFSIGLVDYQLYNNNKSQYAPPVIQGFTRTACTGSPCDDSNILHAKGIVINTDKFNMRQNPSSQDVKTASDNKRIPEGKRIFSVHAKPGNYGETTTDISTTDNEPCNGSIFCLTKFYVTTGSYYTNIPKDDIFEWNVYNKTSTFPNYKWGRNNDSTSLAHDGTDSDRYVYDLYIGTDTSDSEIDNANNVTLSDINSGANGTALDPKKKEFDKYQKRRNYIDVGKAAAADGLKQERLTLPGATNITPRPPILDTVNVHSLNIRTVKTAVNFLEEFKETSTGLDRLRDSVKFDLDCVLSTKDNPFVGCQNPQNISSTCTTWDRIKTKDCSLVCPRKKKDDGTAYNDCSAKIYAIKLIKESSFYVCKQLGGKIDGANCSGTGTVDSCDGGIDREIFPAVSSDARLKNISGDNTAGIKEINKLKVVNYTYKADKAKTPHVGVIAQDLKKVFPDAVKKGSDGYYRIRLEDMFYAMINSVQQLSDRKDDLNELTVDYIDTPLSELQKQNADIKAQNELLKQKNAEMEKRLSKLEAK